MSIIMLIVVLAVIGLLLYLANAYLPMEPRIKQIMNGVVIIAVVVWLLFTFMPGIADVRVPTH